MSDESPAGDHTSWLPEILVVAVVVALIAIVFGGFMLITQMPRALGQPTPTPATPLPLLTGPIGGARGKIAYISGASPNSDILLIDPATGQISRLTAQIGYYANPAWSPDGTMLAYEGPGPTGQDIFVQRVDGTSQPLNLTGSQNWDAETVWSPDGTHILFRADVRNGQALYLTSADGKSLTAVTTPQMQNVLGSWSPDGEQIVYMTFDNQGQRVMQLTMDGTSTPVPLTDTSVMASAPQWSPGPGEAGDGEWIAYLRVAPNNTTDLCLMRPGGGDQRCLTDSSLVVNELAWSPDGTQIAFSASGGTPGLFGAPTSQSQLWVVNVDADGPAGPGNAGSPDPAGSGLKQITNSPGANFWLSWSPDGKQIAFVSTRDGPQNIYLINPDGTGLTSLTSGPGPDSSPAWGK